MNLVSKKYYHKVSSIAFLAFTTLFLTLIPLVAAFLFLPPQTAKRFVILFSSVGIFTIIYLIRRLKRYSIEITNNSFNYRDGKKTYSLSSAYRYSIELVEEDVEQFTLYFKTDDSDDDERTVAINLSNFENSTELISWIKKNLKLSIHSTDDTDLEIKQIHEEIDSTSETTEKKQVKRKQYTTWRTRTKILSFIPFILFMWLYIFPFGTDLPLFLSLLCTGYCLFLPKISNGTVKLAVKKTGTKRPIIGSSLFFLGITMIAFQIIDYPVVSINDYIPVTAVFFIGYTIILLLIAGDNRKEFFIIFCAVGIALVLSLGTAGTINTLFINQPDQVVLAKVIKKTMVKAKYGHDFYLELNATLPFRENLDYQATAKLYKKYNEGDMVKIYIYRGNLHIPFYSVH